MALGGKDTLNGGAGNDILDGGAGDDTLIGGAGADSLQGGAGIDRANYAASGVAVNVSLATGQGTGGDAQGDTLFGIEDLTGSAYNDILEGDGGNNKLAGGSGVDTISYEHATGGVTVSLAVTSAQTTGGAGTDTLSGFENLTGSNFNDVLTGSSGENVLRGLAGDDQLTGGSGKDVLDGGAGTDLLTGGSGADIFMFTALSDSSASAPDVITDFVRGDIIDLSAIDAVTGQSGNQAFKFGGQSSSVLANSATWFQTSSGHIIVQADVDGNSTADFMIVLASNQIALKATDFLL